MASSTASDSLKNFQNSHECNAINTTPLAFNTPLTIKNSDC